MQSLRNLLRNSYQPQIRTGILLSGNPDTDILSIITTDSTGSASIIRIVASNRRLQGHSERINLMVSECPGLS